MNWLVRPLALAVFLVAATLPLKLAADRAPVDGPGENRAKAAALGRFLATQRVGKLQFVRPNAQNPDWAGWRFAAGRCGAFVIADVTGPDSLQLLRREKNARAQTIFIYRGVARSDYPYLRLGFDEIVTRLIWSVYPARWRRPFALIGFFDGDCRSVLAWDWSPLTAD